MKVLVTGGNQGIGFALCRQLVLEHGCHVLLSARTAQKGIDAVAEIQKAIDDDAAAKGDCKGSVEFLQMDTSDDASVTAAAATYQNTHAEDAEDAKDAKSPKLDAIVNNAGIGIKTGKSESVMNTNLYGVKRVCDAFLPFLETNGGRVVNVGSGAGPIYVKSLTTDDDDTDDQRFLCEGGSGASSSSSSGDKAFTWEDIDNYAKTHADAACKNTNDFVGEYGLSKALLSVYTTLLARQNPTMLISCITPGFINTQLTAGYGSKKGPAEGTLAIKKCLLEDLPHGSGWYYGSDGVRSPYHFMRSPGEPEYDGINPFQSKE